MKIYFNLSQLYRLTLGFIKPRVAPTDEIFVHFFVWPWLTEFWVNLQASEFTLMTDSGRWELAMRSGLMGKLLQRKAWVVVGGQKILYRRSIPIFSRVKISVQVIGWEGDWFYIAHRFTVRDRLCALSFVRLAARTRRGVIPFRELLPSEALPSAPLSEEIRLVFEGDGSLLKAFER